MVRKQRLLIVVFSGVLFLLPAVFFRNPVALAAEASAQIAGRESLFRFGRQSLGIAGGHGLALPLHAHRGSDPEDVQFFYLSPRWGIGLSDPLGANTWYRGNFELVIEGAFLYAFEPKHGVAGGITPLIRYNFLAGDHLIPFVQFGAGILELDFNLRRQADGLNFTAQAGLGFHYFVSERTALTGEWRFHHISNAGINTPNTGINSSLLFIGMTVFLN